MVLCLKGGEVKLYMTLNEIVFYCFCLPRLNRLLFCFPSLIIYLLSAPVVVTY